MNSVSQILSARFGVLKFSVTSLVWCVNNGQFQPHKHLKVKNITWKEKTMVSVLLILLYSKWPKIKRIWHTKEKLSQEKILVHHTLQETDTYASQAQGENNSFIKVTRKIPNGIWDPLTTPWPKNRKKNQNTVYKTQNRTKDLVLPKLIVIGISCSQES